MSYHAYNTTCGIRSRNGPRRSEKKAALNVKDFFGKECGLINLVNDIINK